MQGTNKFRKSQINLKETCLISLENCDDKERIRNYINVLSIMKAVEEYQYGAKLQAEIEKVFQDLMSKYVPESPDIKRVKQ